MLDVLCSESELAEYAQVVAVGDSVRRLGVRSQEVWFGSGLDSIGHRFDRYAEVVGGLAPLAIAGEVDAVAAIYLRLTGGDGAWGPQPGSSWLEPLRSTRDTRRPARRIVWTSGGLDADGHERFSGRPDHREGDEVLWGWRFTLTDAVVEPWAPLLADRG